MSQLPSWRQTLLRKSYHSAGYDMAMLANYTVKLNYRPGPFTIGLETG